MTINKLFIKKNFKNRLESSYEFKIKLTKYMIIGVYKKEKNILQPVIFIINIILKKENLQAREDIKKIIHNYNIKSNLLEHMLHNISCLILTNIADIVFLRCKVNKPKAIKNADHASLCLTFYDKGIYE